MPEVSVVIPLYNKGPHIARTLNSVLNQTFRDFEVVVVDDGSTDDGSRVVNGFHDPRVRLIQQANQGVSAARNRGVEEAKTDFIAFLDADDEWMPLHLETIMRLRKRYPDAGMYSTTFTMQMPDGKTIMADYREIQSAPWEGLLPNYFRSAALGVTPVCSSVVGIPKNVFKEIGGFPRGYWFGEDENLWGKIALKFPVAFSWEPGGVYHWDATNRATAHGGPIDYEEPFVKTARDALNRGNVRPEFIEPLKEIIYRKECYRASKNALAGNGKAARAILRQCKTKWHYKTKIKVFLISLFPHSLISFFKDRVKND